MDTVILNKKVSYVLKNNPIKRYKKHITFIFAFVLWLPLIVQTIHVFDDHEHIVCQSLKEQHIHKLAFDCSKLHIPFTTLSVAISSVKKEVLQHIYQLSFTTQPQKPQVVFLSKKSSRAPPFFLN